MLVCMREVDVVEGCRARRPWGPKQARTDAERRAVTKRRWLQRDGEAFETVLAAAQHVRRVCDDDPAASRALADRWPALDEAIGALVTALDRELKGHA